MVMVIVIVGLMFLLLFTIHLKRQIVVSLHLNQIAFIGQKKSLQMKTNLFLTSCHQARQAKQ